MVPLTMATKGGRNIIRRITGRDEVRRHLADMGFVVGECVEVISKIGGNMILNIKNTRVALGESMTNRILV